MILYLFFLKDWLRTATIHSLLSCTSHVTICTTLAKLFSELYPISAYNFSLKMFQCFLDTVKNINIIIFFHYFVFLYRVQYLISRAWMSPLTALVCYYRRSWTAISTVGKIWIVLPVRRLPLANQSKNSHHMITKWTSKRDA